MALIEQPAGVGWLAAAALFTLLGCGLGEPPGRKIPPEATLTVVFRLSGDDFGGTEDLRERDRVARAVEASGAGRVVSSGNGMGFMDFHVEPPDLVRAEDRLRAAVASARPTFRYEVTRH